jgi:hypothetical protein
VQLVELAGEAERHLVIVGYTGVPVSAPMSKFSSHCEDSAVHEYGSAVSARRRELQPIPKAA